MSTGFEGIGPRAVIDALVNLINSSNNKRVTAMGRAALKEAMRDCS